MDGPVPTTADVVIAGGGTTGLVVATRLAKADPSLSIVVLESGIGTRDNPSIVNPALWITNILPGSKTAKFYKAKASKAVNGREIVIPSGGCVGGGSSINFMVYSRPQLIDFDDWNTEGWTGKDMIPYFKTYEDFQDNSPGIDESVHGYGGEFGISSGTNAQLQFQEDYLKAWKEVGLPQTPDVQDLKTSNAVGIWNKWIDGKTGRRQDVAHRLLYPLLDTHSTKLLVVTQTKVVRILFDAENKATAVEYLPAESETSSTPSVIKTNKLVVVASGALGSPQVLERSGVGDEDRLSKLGIKVISDLPGVGSNYQDHNVVFYPYRSSATASQTLDGILSSRLTLEAAVQEKAANPTRYVLGWNGFDGCGKVRPSTQDEAQLGAELRSLWERDYKARPTRPLMLTSVLAGLVGDHSGVAPTQHFSMGPYTPYPYSRGAIHIAGRAVADDPDFDAGFLTHPADLQKLVWGYKQQRDVARRMAHYRGALEVAHPVFAEGSKAGYAYVDERDRKSGKVEPIEYSKEDDEAIELFIRQNVSTTWHSMGTCAMKPRAEGGVVDGRLNVFGVQRLKVVDLSICPSNVAANTYATALAVGHKAAVLIAEELGVPYSV